MLAGAGALDHRARRRRRPAARRRRRRHARGLAARRRVRRGRARAQRRQPPLGRRHRRSDARRSSRCTSWTSRARSWTASRPIRAISPFDHYGTPVASGISLASVAADGADGRGAGGAGDLALRASRRPRLTGGSRWTSLVLTFVAAGTALATGLGALPVLWLGDRVVAWAPALWGAAGGVMAVAAVVGLLLPALDEGSALEVVGGRGRPACSRSGSRESALGRRELHLGLLDAAASRRGLLVAGTLFAHSLPGGPGDRRGLGVGHPKSASSSSWRSRSRTFPRAWSRPCR